MIGVFVDWDVDWLPQNACIVLDDENGKKKSTEKGLLKYAIKFISSGTCICCWQYENNCE